MHGQTMVRSTDDQINAALSGIKHPVDIVPVDNPLATIRGQKSDAIRSLRDDPLASMHARKQIDDARFNAGREWQRHNEESQIGGVSAIDPTREAVDGGRMPDLLTQRRMHASDEIANAKKELGWAGNNLIENILGHRKSIQEYAMGLGMTTQREFDYIGRRFRECLETLARLWGYA